MTVHANSAQPLASTPFYKTQLFKRDEWSTSGASLLVSVVLFALFPCEVTLTLQGDTVVLRFG